MFIVAFAVYFFLFFLVDSFCFYLTSPAPERMQAAEQNAAEVEEEAKRTIAAHPDWSNDAIAQHCGFTDRTVLQRTFKRMEGITPQKYQENMSKGE